MSGSVGVSSHRFEITSTWDGHPLREDEYARVDLTVGAEVLIQVSAAFFDDPAPNARPGRLDGLWNFEVVELFLLGEGDDYLEIELGPHGHWLALRLTGRRQISNDRVPIDFATTRAAASWSGEARLSLDWLPENIRAANAYAIHGVGPARRFLAMHAAPGNQPDFHQLESFGPLTIP
jgi:hypothetical protein